MRQIHKSAWLLVLLSAILQILIFPLPDWYPLCWICLAPLLVALLRSRRPATLQLRESIKLIPANPIQGFVLGYVCGIIWYAGTCYWIYRTMRQYGGLDAPSALGILILFCLYLALYHGVFGLITTVLAGKSPFSRRALLLAPAAWVALELARAGITGFPWDLLGISQVDNIPLARIASVTGVYGISFEIMLVNAAFAAVMLVERGRRKRVLLAAITAAIVLQCGRLINPAPVPSTETARLIQADIPILQGSDWTRDYFENTLRELTRFSLNSPGAGANHPSLIAWPESPAPFYSSDPLFHDVLSNVARQADTSVVSGVIGTENASSSTQESSKIYNSAILMNPDGDIVARYDKVHLVPFGEYVPFKKVFAFAGGLTQEVGDFQRGSSRRPLPANGTRLGVFICYESIFPNEVRQFAANGAQVFLNLSNDGWYGDSGAYAQHLKQTRMRAIEDARWVLLDTNTGVTASVDPYGRIVSSLPRKVRAALDAPFAASTVTTFYIRHGDWFAYLCAIISAGALSYCVLRERQAPGK